MPLYNPVLPAGTVVPFAGTAEPNGYLFCYGQAVSRTGYAALFAALGTTYGSGDGTTTFNLPDLRGRVIAGQDDMGGSSANRLTNQTGGLDGDTLGATGGAETGRGAVATCAAAGAGVMRRSTVGDELAGASATFTDTVSNCVVSCTNVEAPPPFAGAVWPWRADLSVPPGQSIWSGASSAGAPGWILENAASS